jgi:hypothetical protein
VPKKRLDPKDFKSKQLRSKQGWIEFFRAGACQSSTMHDSHFGVRSVFDFGISGHSQVSGTYERALAE